VIGFQRQNTNTESHRGTQNTEEGFWIGDWNPRAYLQTVSYQGGDEGARYNRRRPPNSASTAAEPTAKVKKSG
jgi:hypothetical protein